jgi:hypothetical protein
MSLTFAVFQPPMFWLNAAAPRNILHLNTRRGRGRAGGSECMCAQ